MKKQKKKLLIIISLVIVLLIGLGVGGYFYFQYKELKKPIKEDWGQKYYVYLKDVNENKRLEDAGLPKDLKKSELSFYEVENVNEPVMVINYQKDNQDYSNVYYISDDKVNTLVYNQPSTVELLYNLENKKYDYYLHVKDKDTNRYKTISQQINDRVNGLKDDKTIRPEEAEYSFKDDDMDKITDVNGKEIILTKFDQTFIKPDIKEDKINFSFDLEEKDLKSKIIKQIKKYTPVEKIITKETQTEVDKKVEEVEKTKEEMTKAKEEVAKKEAEEKAKKEAEEREKASASQNTNNSSNSSSSNNGLMSQAQADNIVKQTYHLDNNLFGESDGIKQSFRSGGLVTYKGDNEKYYYYSSYNVFDTHNSYNGSFIVNAKTGKIKFVAYMSRTAPSDGIVPYSSEDVDIN